MSNDNYHFSPKPWSLIQVGTVIHDFSNDSRSNSQILRRLQEHYVFAGEPFLSGVKGHTAEEAIKHILAQEANLPNVDEYQRLVINDHITQGIGKQLIVMRMSADNRIAIAALIVDEERMLIITLMELSSSNEVDQLLNAA